MAIRNRFLAFFYRLIILGVGVYAAYLLFNYHAVGNEPTRGLYYFECQTLLFATIVLFAEVIANGIGLSKKTNGVVPGVWSPIFLAALSFVIFDSAVYASNAWATGTDFFVNADKKIMLFSKIIFPLLFLADYLLFGEKGTVKWKHPIFWGLYPLFYFLFSLLVHQIFNQPFWTVAFFNNGSAYFSTGLFSGNGGWNGVVICSFCAWLGYNVIAYLIIFFNYLYAGVYKKHDHNEVI
jgi:hypothetical protein